MTTKELINQYVTAHADNRWMDASELEALLTEFAEKLKEPTSEDLEQATEKAIRWFENIADECDKLTSGNAAHLKAQIKGMAIRSAEYLTKHSQEPASDDLEDAASSFAREDSKGIRNPANFYYTVADKARIFKAGVQWNRDQMMKGAIDTRIDKRLADMIGYTGSERVKVIIIKE